MTPSDRNAPERTPSPQRTPPMEIDPVAERPPRTTAGGAGDSPPPRPVGLWLLFRAFGTVGVISMGGGRFAYYFHELVTRRRWISEQEMLERLAISQLLPGPNISNLAVLLGQRLRGFRGAALALIATLGPGALLMLGLSAFYFARGQVPGAGPAFRGIAAAAAGLALGTTLQIGWKSARGVRAALLAGLTLLAILVLHLPTLLTILLLGGLGVLLFRTAPHPPVHPLAPQRVGGKGRSRFGRHTTGPSNPPSRIVIEDGEPTWQPTPWNPCPNAPPSRETRSHNTEGQGRGPGGAA